MPKSDQVATLVLESLSCLCFSCSVGSNWFQPSCKFCIDFFYYYCFDWCIFFCVSLPLCHCEKLLASFSALFGMIKPSFEKLYEASRDDNNSLPWRQTADRSHPAKSLVSERIHKQGYFLLLWKPSLYSKVQKALTQWSFSGIFGDVQGGGTGCHEVCDHLSRKQSVIKTTRTRKQRTIGKKGLLW